jgi:protein-disulfide isomerase
VNKWLNDRNRLLLVAVAAIILSATLITLSCARSNEESGSTSVESPDDATPAQSENSTISNGESTTQTENVTEPKPTIIVSGTSIGSPTAPITIIEYSDFQCHFCQKFALEIEPLIDQHYIQTGKARLVFKHLVAFGPESGVAAEASECAAEQNQFWPYYHALMRLRLSSTVEEDITSEKVQEIAQQIGLNMTLFNESLFSRKFYDKVQQENAEGRDLGFTSIPTFFINGVKADEKVAGSFDEFSKLLDAELERLGQ